MFFLGSAGPCRAEKEEVDNGAEGFVAESSSRNHQPLIENDSQESSAAMQGSSGLPLPMPSTGMASASSCSGLREPALQQPQAVSFAAIPGASGPTNAGKLSAPRPHQALCVVYLSFDGRTLLRDDHW